MTQTFTHPFWKRELIVDDGGITVRRAGRDDVFVPWERLDRLGSGRIRSDSGVTISTGLPRGQSRKFFHCASQVWRDKVPERWRRNHVRILRFANRLVYVAYPLLMLGPSVAFYISFWFLGRPESMLPLFVRFNRLTVIAVVLLVVTFIWYARMTRKAAQKVLI